MLKDILKILENDARTTPKQIADMTGMSQAEVAKLIKKAWDDRTIIKYKAIINWDSAENERVYALIEVKLEPQKDVGFDSIAERIYRFPQTRNVYLVSGTYDLLVLVVGKNNHEVASFVSQKLSHIDGVKATNTQFILKRYKEDGEIFEGREEVRRQPVVL
ncbi:MAG TPA: Lrp/AsnC family transcriptional regulator [Dehalococcoidales bacterium]|nr:Lrp/AsnC family transcriptional regulator [Dehalococcoidales bacterium]